MKIDINNIDNTKKIIEKIPVHFNDLEVCFPVDIKIETVDAFGMKTNTFKTESYYGNHYIFVLLPNKLGYVASTDLISLNLAEYFALTKNDVLTEEEIKTITQYECCLIPKERIHYSEDNLI